MKDENKLLVEKKFLLNCGYTIDEVKQLTEGFGVTNPVSTQEGEASDPAKAKASAQYNQLLSLLTNLFKGKVPPEIATLTSEIKTYFSGGPINPSQIARTPDQGDGYSEF